MSVERRFGSGLSYAVSLTMIDQKTKNQLILCRELLSASPILSVSPTAQILHDLIVSYGAVELALAAICVELNCVPDKKDLCLRDYFSALQKACLPASPIAGAEFMELLHRARCQSQLRFHAPDRLRFERAKEEMLKHVSAWCRQCLSVDFLALTILTRERQDGVTPSANGDAPKTAPFAGPVGARYACVGSADIRLSRWGQSEKGSVANLSIGGCNIRSNFSFDVGEKIELILEVNGTSFRVAGKIAHVPPEHIAGNGNSMNHGVGIKFENMTAGALIRLKDLIRELNNRPVAAR